MRLLIAVAVLLTAGQPAEALLLWNWSYSGAGVAASGTFTTNDTPDGAGFYRIVGITGADNGAAITGLQPAGTAIPGNEPYAVDNLVSAVEPRLTTHGFGFSLANGNNYANPFYNGSSYYEYLSVPPYVNGAGPEKPVSFAARHCSGAERSLAHACGSSRPHRLRPNLYAAGELKPIPIPSAGSLQGLDTVAHRFQIMAKRVEYSQPRCKSSTTITPRSRTF